ALGKGRGSRFSPTHSPNRPPFVNLLLTTVSPGARKGPLTKPMSDNARFSTYFHLHLVSDSTGETLNAMARAVCARFDDVLPIEHIYSLVRSPRQLERVLREVEGAPGVVLH